MGGIDKAARLPMHLQQHPARAPFMSQVYSMIKSEYNPEMVQVVSPLSDLWHSAG